MDDLLTLKPEVLPEDQPGRCIVCRSPYVYVNKDGRLRKHRVMLPQAEQDPTTHLGRYTECMGSGLRPSGALTASPEGT